MAVVFAPLLAPLVTAGILSTAAAGAVASGLGLLATTAVSYFLQQAIAPDTAAKDPGVRQTLAFGDDVPQSFIVGTYATAGSLVYANTWGTSGKTPNAYLVQVFQLSDLPCEALGSSFWVNNRKCTIATTGEVAQGFPVTTFRDGSTDHMWVKFFDGTQTTASSYLTGKFASDPKFPWTSSMIGRGRAYAIVTTLYNRDKFSGLPSFVFEVDGVKLYDPRLDGTNGGTGSHRYGTASTHAFTRNAKVIAYNLARGIQYDGAWYYGGQVWAARRLDNDSWFAAMNVCDEAVDLKGGGTEPRFRVGAEIRLDDQPIDVIERIDVSCNGRTAESGGVYKTYCGGYGSSVLSITDADILITEEASASYFPGHEKWVNTIRPSYVNPRDMWQTRALKAKTRAAYVTADGGQILEQSVALDMVTSASQAQRVALAMLNDARRMREHVIVLPPYAKKLEAFDKITWTSSKFPYSAKKFKCGNVSRLPEGWVRVPIRELDETDFDFDELTDEDDADDTILDDIEPAAFTLTFTSSSSSIQNNAGTGTKPAILCEWTYDADLADVSAIKFQVRDRDTLQKLPPSRTDDIEDGEHVISNGLVRGQRYQVRARVVPGSARATEWSAWQNVTVADVGEAAVVANGSITTEKLSDEAATTQKIAKGAVSGTGSIFIPNQIYIDMPSLRWTGSAENTTYTETISLADWKQIVNNANPNPVSIAGRFGFVVLPQGPTNGQFDKKYVIDMQLLFQAIPPDLAEGTESNWRTLDRLREHAEYGRGEALGRFVRTKQIAIQHLVSRPSDAGNWKYRVKAVLQHRRGDNNFTDFQVWINAAINFNWSKR